MADNCAALRRGELDVVQLFQPHAEELIRIGVGHVWYAAADRGPTAYTSLNTRRSVIAEKGDELLAMARAVCRTLDWVHASDGQTIADAVAAYFPDVPRPVFAAALDRYKAHRLYGRDSVLTREGFERLRAAMLSGGAIRHGASYEACVDTAIAERAVAEAGR
jgi:NitT/TauT family transport system substrate-binding protein